MFYYRLRVSRGRFPSEERAVREIRLVLSLFQAGLMQFFRIFDANFSRNPAKSSLNSDVSYGDSMKSSRTSLKPTSCWSSLLTSVAPLVSGKPAAVIEIDNPFLKSGPLATKLISKDVSYPRFELVLGTNSLLLFLTHQIDCFQKVFFCDNHFTQFSGFFV